MSDERLRELERCWRESGSVEDEAAYLRERVRAGDVSQERLELSAALGHEPSAALASGSLAEFLSSLLFGWEGPDSSLSYEEELGLPSPSRWRYGEEAARRSFLAIASASWRRRKIYQHRPVSAVEEAIELLEERLLGGAPTATRASRVLGDLGLFADEDCLFEPQDTDPTLVVLMMLSNGDLAQEIGESLCPVVDHFAEAEEWVRSALKADVLPWALGYADPVRERVEARMRKSSGSEKQLEKEPSGADLLRPER